MSKYNYKAWPWKAISYGAVVFIVALLIRIIYLYQAGSSPTFYLPIVDSTEYHEIAKTLVTDGVMRDTFFLQGFFYPFFLSRVYFFTGSSILIAKILQIILGSVTCLLVYLLGCKILDRTIGVIAGLMTAVYGPIIFFETELLATSWACFWPVLLILLFLTAARPNKSWFYLVTGLCTGLSIITRAPFIPFTAALFIWLIVALRTAGLDWKAIAKKASVLVAGTAIVLGIVASLCYVHTGQFSPLPQSGPVNLYIGNNPNPDQTISARAGSGWYRLWDMAKQQGAENEQQAREFFMHQFFKYILEQPKDFLKNLIYKSVQFFSSREIPRTFDIYLASRYSPLLSALTFKIGKFGFPFGLFLPLAIFGLISKVKKIPAPIALFLVLYLPSVILVFAAARYRAPMIPVMSLFAAAGLMVFTNLIRTARWAPLAALVISAVLIGGASSVAGPFTPEKFNFEAEMHYCIGYHMWDNEDFDQAQMHLSKAVSLTPDYADAHNVLGRTLYEKGQYQQARQHLETAIKLNPSSYSGHYYLGKVMLEFGENSVALEEFEKAAELAGQAGNIRFAATAKQAAGNCQKQTLQDR